MGCSGEVLVPYGTCTAWSHEVAREGEARPAGHASACSPRSLPTCSTAASATSACATLPPRAPVTACSSTTSGRAKGFRSEVVSRRGGPARRSRCSSRANSRSLPGGGNSAQWRQLAEPAPWPNERLSSSSMARRCRATGDGRPAGRHRRSPDRAGRRVRDRAWRAAEQARADARLGRRGHRGLLLGPAGEIAHSRGGGCRAGAIRRAARKLAQSEAEPRGRVTR